MFMNVLTKLNAYFNLNIKYLSSSQNKFALSKSIQNSSKIFDDIFKRINVQRFKFTTNVKDFIKTFESTMSKLNVYINAFI